MLCNCDSSLGLPWQVAGIIGFIIGIVVKSFIRER